MANKAGRRSESVTEGVAGPVRTEGLVVVGSERVGEGSQALLVRRLLQHAGQLSQLLHIRDVAEGRADLVGNLRPSDGHNKLAS